MKLGMVGLGKMGANMALRLVVGSPDGSVPGRHTVMGFDPTPPEEFRMLEGLSLAGSLEDLIAGLPKPRVIWTMVPAGTITETTIARLTDLLEPGDVLIDGGNSNFNDTMRRNVLLEQRKIGFIDAGVSGGIWGRAEGYCLMVGGNETDIEIARPIFEQLAPKDGWAHVGPVGSGHYVKMVHNGVEYGLMQAYAEGFDIMHKAPFPLDMAQITALWNHGSVVRSWLLELAERVFEVEGNLRDVQPWVEDSGEGRWTIQAAIAQDVAVPVISAALFARFDSRDTENFSARFNAALRKAFGGHAVKYTKA